MHGMCHGVLHANSSLPPGKGLCLPFLDRHFICSKLNQGDMSISATAASLGRATSDV